MTDQVWKAIAVFFVSALPLVESKGAILVARLWHMSFWVSGPLCVIGSFIPAIVLLFSKGGHHRLHPRLSKKLLTIPPSVEKYIERYGCWALLVLIAIPFTGMGCWPGALIARATHMNKVRAAICIFIGNVIAVVLLTGCIHGVVTAIEKLLGL